MSTTVSFAIYHLVFMSEDLNDLIERYKECPTRVYAQSLSKEIDRIYKKHSFLNLHIDQIFYILEECDEMEPRKALSIYKRILKFHCTTIDDFLEHVKTDNNDVKRMLAKSEDKKHLSLKVNKLESDMEHLQSCISNMGKKSCVFVPPSGPSSSDSTENSYNQDVISNLSNNFEKQQARIDTIEGMVNDNSSRIDYLYSNNEKFSRKLESMQKEIDREICSKSGSSSSKPLIHDLREDFVDDVKGIIHESIDPRLSNIETKINSMHNGILDENAASRRRYSVDVDDTIHSDMTEKIMRIQANTDEITKRLELLEEKQMQSRSRYIDYQDIESELDDNDIISKIDRLFSEADKVSRRVLELENLHAESSVTNGASRSFSSNGTPVSKGFGSPSLSDNCYELSGGNESPKIQEMTAGVEESIQNDGFVENDFGSRFFKLVSDFKDMKSRIEALENNSPVKKCDYQFKELQVDYDSRIDDKIASKVTELLASKAVNDTNETIIDNILEEKINARLDQLIGQNKALSERLDVLENVFLNGLDNEMAKSNVNGKLTTIKKLIDSDITNKIDRINSDNLDIASRVIALENASIQSKYSYVSILNEAVGKVVNLENIIENDITKLIQQMQERNIFLDRRVESLENSMLVIKDFENRRSIVSDMGIDDRVETRIKKILEDSELILRRVETLEKNLSSCVNSEVVSGILDEKLISMNSLIEEKLESRIRDAIDNSELSNRVDLLEKKTAEISKNTIPMIHESAEKISNLESLIENEIAVRLQEIYQRNTILNERVDYLGKYSLNQEIEDRIDQVKADILNKVASKVREMIEKNNSSTSDETSRQSEFVSDDRISKLVRSIIDDNTSTLVNIVTGKSTSIIDDKLAELKETFDIKLQSTSTHFENENENLMKRVELLESSSFLANENSVQISAEVEERLNNIDLLIDESVACRMENLIKNNEYLDKRFNSLEKQAAETTKEILPRINESEERISNIEFLIEDEISVQLQALQFSSGVTNKRLKDLENCIVKDKPNPECDERIESNDFALDDKIQTMINNSNSRLMEDLSKQTLEFSSEGVTSRIREFVNKNNNRIDKKTDRASSTLEPQVQELEERIERPSRTFETPGNDTLLHDTKPGISVNLEEMLNNVDNLINERISSKFKDVVREPENIRMRGDSLEESCDCDIKRNSPEKRESFLKKADSESFVRGNTAYRHDEIDQSDNGLNVKLGALERSRDIEDHKLEKKINKIKHDNNSSLYKDISTDVISAQVKDLTRDITSAKAVIHDVAEQLLGINDVIDTRISHGFENVIDGVMTLERSTEYKTSELESRVTEIESVVNEDIQSRLDQIVRNSCKMSEKIYDNEISTLNLSERIGKILSFDDSVDIRLGSLEDRMNKTEKIVHDCDSYCRDRINDIEKSVSRAIDEKIKDISNNNEVVLNRIETLENFSGSSDGASDQNKVLLETRIQDIESVIDEKVDSKFDIIVRRMEVLESNTQALEDRSKLSECELKQAITDAGNSMGQKMVSKIETMIKKVEDLENNTNNLEVSGKQCHSLLNEKIAGIESIIDEKLSSEMKGVNKRFTELETEVNFDRIKRAELSERVRIIEDKVNNNNALEQVASLSERVHDIESEIDNNNVQERMIAMDEKVREIENVIYDNDIPGQVMFLNEKVKEIEHKIDNSDMARHEVPSSEKVCRFGVKINNNELSRQIELLDERITHLEQDNVTEKRVDEIVNIVLSNIDETIDGRVSEKVRDLVADDRCIHQKVTEHEISSLPLSTFFDSPKFKVSKNVVDFPESNYENDLPTEHEVNSNGSPILSKRVDSLEKNYSEMSTSFMASQEPFILEERPADMDTRASVIGSSRIENSSFMNNGFIESDGVSVLPKESEQSLDTHHLTVNDVMEKVNNLEQLIETTIADQLQNIHESSIVINRRLDALEASVPILSSQGYASGPDDQYRLGSRASEGSRDDMLLNNAFITDELPSMEIAQSKLNVVVNEASGFEPLAEGNMMPRFRQDSLSNHGPARRTTSLENSSGLANCIMNEADTSGKNNDLESLINRKVTEKVQPLSEKCDIMDGRVSMLEQDQTQMGMVGQVVEDLMGTKLRKIIADNNLLFQRVDDLERRPVHGASPCTSDDRIALERYLWENERFRSEVRNFTQLIKPNDLIEDIFEACKRGDVESVKWLVYENPELVHARDSKFYDSTPLHHAANGGHLDICKVLIAKGASMTAKINNKLGWNPFHLACIYNHKDIVNYFIRKGASVHTTSGNGETPLHYSAQKGNTEICEVLLDNGAEIDAVSRIGKTALHYAAEKNYEKTVEFLIRRGANIDIKTPKGETPLSLSEDYGYFRIISMLQRRRAAG